MEEKERYKLERPNGTFSQIHDTKLDVWYLNRQPIAELLNKQDKRIKELEEENKQIQKQLAIEANEKAVSVLKELRFAFNESIGDGMLRNYVCCLIDDQIKELKGEE